MKSILFILGLTGVVIAGVVHAATPSPTKSVVTYATAIMTPTKDSTVNGKVTFTEQFGKVKVEGELSGLEPNSEHGFHIHEFGDCSTADGASAGGHFNPQNQPHGPMTGAHHAGDFGNVKADASGHAVISEEISDVSLEGPRNAIIGRGVIVHKTLDDLKTQPTGNAGARLACGVIGVASATTSAPAKK
jgi:Cu-Zn family superoxide dismutase